MLSLSVESVRELAMGVKRLQRLKFSDCVRMESLLNVGCISDIFSCPIQELTIARCNVGPKRSRKCDVIPELLKLVLSAEVEVHVPKILIVTIEDTISCLKDLVSLVTTSWYQPGKHISSTALVFFYPDYKMMDLEMQNLLRTLSSYGFNITLRADLDSV
eukprot:GILJ01011177.1.p1 GENE.GILJ01011177.1~~GILJ01011177.1.p1  ORF type:complete len:160 (+),score=13.02 GILJ01011177.1:416-895(+)